MNQLYAYAKERFLTGQLNWLTMPFSVLLVDTTQYAVQATIHRTLADVPALARQAVSGALTGTSATGGVAKADNVSVTLPGSGAFVTGALIIFHNTGTDNTSELVAYLDTASGLPLTSVSSVTIQWDGGPNGIFKL